MQGGPSVLSCSQGTTAQDPGRAGLRQACWPVRISEAKAQDACAPVSAAGQLTEACCSLPAASVSMLPSQLLKCPACWTDRALPLMLKVKNVGYKENHTCTSCTSHAIASRFLKPRQSQ